MRTTTIDLADEVDKIRDEKIKEIEKAQENLIKEFEEEYGSYSDVPSEEEGAFNRLEEERQELLGTAKALENAIEEWGGGEFVISELDTGSIARIQDRVSEKSFQFDPEQGQLKEGTPKQGFGMVETMRVAIQKQPEGAPIKRDNKGNPQIAPGQYPHQVGLYLFEKINNYNTVGDVDLGNSSLRERMESSS